MIISDNVDFDAVYEIDEEEYVRVPVVAWQPESADGPGKPLIEANGSLYPVAHSKAQEKHGVFIRIERHLSNQDEFWASLAKEINGVVDNIKTLANEKTLRDKEDHTYKSHQ